MAASTRVALVAGATRGLGLETSRQLAQAGVTVLMAGRTEGDVAQVTAALADTPIKVNSAHPGWVKTDMGSEAAPMEIVDGAETSVALALLDADGPTGSFVHLGDTLPW